MSNLSLMVRGRPIDTFQHEGKSYVEGRRGTEYSISFVNNCNERRKIVLSVDGLNVMTGDSTWDRGYVVEPYQVINIPGWRKSANNVAAFKFASLKDSYNQHNASGQASSVGVIGCKVFREKPKLFPQQVYHYHYNQPWNVHYSTGGGSFSGIGIASSMQNMNVANDGHTVSNMMAQGRAAEGQISSVMRSANFMAPVADDTPVGTGWGEDKQFKTTAIEFESESTPCETLVLYYDSYERLKARGIIPEYRLITLDPDPFPDGCPAPISR